MTQRYLAELAWIGGDELASDVLLEVEGGRFTAVRPGADHPDVTRFGGVVLPGLVNAHSHAFHRLLRGRTHQVGGDFWRWRELMYQTANALDPDIYEQVATAVFVEMALAGITTVGEFHYLHHQAAGERYPDPNAMGRAVVRAAGAAGIRLTLLDACYLAGGFDGRPLQGAQTRFGDGTVETWLERVGALADTYDGSDDVVVGLAPHSVRAVPDDALRAIAASPLRTGRPLHVHVSEQPSENEACRAATGLTPTALLSRAGLLDEHATIVHGTHLSDDDIAALGRAGTGTCYCATTERDLGDGLGPGAALHAAGSPLSIGSDSHALIDVFEEARGIELHERLATGRRGVISPTVLLEAATVNGSRSLGWDTGRLAVGAPADFIALGGTSLRLAGGSTDVASVVFAATAADVTDVVVGGRAIVSGGVHPAAQTARTTLEAVMTA